MSQFFCRAMLCISAAYAVVRCPSGARHVRVLCPNGYRYDHSYRGMRIRNRTQVLEWYRFQWP